MLKATERIFPSSYVKNVCSSFGKGFSAPLKNWCFNDKMSLFFTHQLLNPINLKENQIILTLVDF